MSNIPIHIETERPEVTLRELTIDDAPAFFAAVDRSRDHVSQYGEPTSRNYPTLESVEESIRHPLIPSRLRMGIWGGDTFAGTISLTPDPFGYASAEVGYWLAADMTRHGYASTAVRALAASVAIRRHYDILTARVHHENIPSQIVLGRCGFRLLFQGIPYNEYELVLRDRTVVTPRERGSESVPPRGQGAFRTILRHLL